MSLVKVYSLEDAKKVLSSSSSVALCCIKDSSINQMITNVDDAELFYTPNNKYHERFFVSILDLISSHYHLVENGNGAPKGYSTYLDALEAIKTFPKGVYEIKKFFIK